jgi:hypothetical protein
MGCTKNMSVFVVETPNTKIKKVVVLKPEIKEFKTYTKSMETALLGSLISNMGHRGYSYFVAWKKMPDVYENFSSRLFLVSKNGFNSKSKDISVLTKTDDDWRDSFLINLNLFGTRFGNALKTIHLKKWEPKYLMVSGVENKGVSFTGSRKLKYYAFIIDRVNRKVIWGIHFNRSCADNNNQIVVTTIKAGKYISLKFLNSSLKFSK